MDIIFIFILGLIAGSFLNSAIYRLEVKKTIIFSRSICPKCGKALKWYELIPLISFIIQKGRCRGCGNKIALQYPLVELSTAILFILFYCQLRIANHELDFKNLFVIFYHFLLVCFLVIIFVYDLKHHIMPDRVIYPAIVFVFIYWLLIVGFDFYTLLAILISGGLFFGLFFFSQGKWMGFGDVELAIFMGIVLGWPDILIALFLSFVFGAIVGLFLIFLGRKTLKSQIPFGPFLCFSTIATLLFDGYMSTIIHTLF